jgi:hypothetical protein
MFMRLLLLRCRFMAPPERRLSIVVGSSDREAFPSTMENSMRDKLLISVFVALLFSGSTVPAAAESDDKAFLKEAIQGNLAEISMGELAQKNGSSEGVRSFGQTLVQDHSAKPELAEAHQGTNAAAAIEVTSAAHRATRGVAFHPSPLCYRHAAFMPAKNRLCIIFHHATYNPQTAGAAAPLSQNDRAARSPRFDTAVWWACDGVLGKGAGTLGL